MKKLLIVLAVLLLAGASVAGVQQTRLLEVILANLQVLDDYKLYFGTGNDASLEYDENGTDQLRIVGATIFENAVEFDGALDVDSTVALGGVMTVADNIGVVFGTDSDSTMMYDETTLDRTLLTTAAASGLNIVDGNLYVGNGVPGQTINGEDAYFEGLVEIDGVAYLEGGVLIPDDIALTFGTDSDASLTYDELVSDVVVAAGKWDFSDVAITDSTAGLFIEDNVPVTFGTDSDATILYDETTDDALEITSTKITMTGAVGVTGAVVGTSTITSSATGSLGWSIVAGANTACNTTCTTACVAGQDAGTANVFVDCVDATADVCICAGAN